MPFHSRRSLAAHGTASRSPLAHTIHFSLLSLVTEWGRREASHCPAQPARIAG